MPYIPHTPDDVRDMLQEIGAASIENLFDEVPADLPRANLSKIPDGMNEMEIKRFIQERISSEPMSCFIGAGAYEHHIPSIVWEIVRRGEFYTAYTPYQAEASQGSLQLIFEYQTMMANLLGFSVSNASLYDGATALAEAILMALRIKKNTAKRILVPANIHPHYRQVLNTILKQHEISLEEIPFDLKTGAVNLEVVKKISPKDLAAVIIAQPSFFGILEAVDELTDFAHQAGALAIAVVNPIAMALLKPPGKWGKNGADIACGEGQPLGVPLSAGGPYFGFMCTKKEFVRQMPGRIVGETVDKNGKRGFVLTLQAREQHIRRAKATSNICTNQGLLVTAAAVYLSVMGAKGLKQVALKSHQNAEDLREKLIHIPGIEPVFNQPFFHEFVLRFNQPVKEILAHLEKNHIQGGLDLSEFFPELKNCLLICVTETKTPEDLDRYARRLSSWN